MLGSIRKFAADRKGAFAIQFALMVVPLTVCTGLAVDGGRAFLARYELAQALDAAALAVGSTGTGTQAQLQQLAQTYVNANFGAKHDEEVLVTLGDNAAGVVVNLKGEVDINTYFMPLIGKDKVKVKAESTIRRGGNSIEVALALDITGSMYEYPAGDTSQRKIDALKDAADILIDTVVALPASQPPNTQIHSRVAIVPWSNNVYVGSTLAPTLRGAVVAPTTDVPSATWKKSTTAIASATWRSGAEFTITRIRRVGTSPNYRIEVTVSDTNTATLANNDIIGLFVTAPGTNSFNSLNNGRYKVSDKAGSGTVASPYTFRLKNYNNDSYVTAPTGTVTNATAGKTQECLTSNCTVRITTSGNHGLAANDFVYISGEAAPYTGLNSSIGAPWTVSSGSTGATLYVQNTSGTQPNGPALSLNNTGTGGTAGSGYGCFTSKCSIRVTMPGHGLEDGAYFRVRNVQPSTWAAEMDNTSSMSGTSSAWQIEQMSGDTFVLKNSEGGMTANYTANSGDRTCFAAGCQWTQYKNLDGAWTLRQITNCVTERVGTNAATDVAAGANNFLGRHYDGDGSSACSSADPIMGLDDDRQDLKDKIADLSTHGVTAGHIGIAWGWYAVSDAWRNVLPVAQAEFQPSVVNTENLSRIVVFMSDGEFNAAHCGGAGSADFGSDNETDDRDANCNAGTSPFDQAKAICDNMRDEKIRVFTVGFDVPEDSDAWEFMQYCATEETDAYLAATGAQLTTAFQEIAADIARLRIAR
jgi:Flp pilus assembly protein TadG